ncbi:hypothetical protein SAMN05216167_102687 [Spirosoma endophyticum]|uniref:Uncharacterized protein n=1 Tax=Spirosoma endophyticum TaxID=662367 RepID=A0A1I1MRM9_9BACT|nr:hypothetical protein SAMN05216167_102687 [Spirosoma endophyticum]
MNRWVDPSLLRVSYVNDFTGSADIPFVATWSSGASKRDRYGYSGAGLAPSKAYDNRSIIDRGWGLFEATDLLVPKLANMD